MPGNIVFIPKEGNFKEDILQYAACDRYCIFSLGDQKTHTLMCEPGKKRSHWHDIIDLVKKSDEDVCFVEVRERTPERSDESMGVAEIDLKEIKENDRVSKWFNVMRNDEVTGQLLIEVDTTYTEHDPHMSLHLGTLVHGDERGKPNKVCMKS